MRDEFTTQKIDDVSRESFSGLNEFSHELSSWQYCVSKNANGQDEVRIIDGQQRLTTLLLLTRALTATLCSLYGNPHKIAAENLKTPQQKFAREVILDLIHVLQAHNLKNSNLSKEWGELVGIEPVLTSDAIDDQANDILRTILLSGRKVPGKSLKYSDRYSENYRFFLSILSHPEFKLFYTPKPDPAKSSQKKYLEKLAEIAKCKAITEHLVDNYQQLKDDDTPPPSNKPSSPVFEPWSDASTLDDAEVGVSLKEYSNLNNNSIDSFRNIFYLDIQSKDWKTPEQNAFSLYSSEQEYIPLEEINEENEQVPFILHFAVTLLHNVRIILHRMADEESALKVFYLTNTAGHPLPRENIIRAAFYQAKLEYKDPEKPERDGKAKADKFVRDWNDWKNKLEATYAHRSEKALEKSVSEALGFALTYFNLKDFTHENSLDGAVGDLVKYGLPEWLRVQKVDNDHVDSVMKFLDAFNKMQEWILLGKVSEVVEKVLPSDDKQTSCLRYLKALNTLGEISLLEPVFYYFIHHTMVEQKEPDENQVLRFIKKHTANVLYRTVVFGNPLQNYSALYLGRDICGARYKRKSKDDFDMEEELRKIAKGKAATDGTLIVYLNK